jgi:hypothetical protein
MKRKTEACSPHRTWAATSPMLPTSITKTGSIDPSFYTMPRLPLKKSRQIGTSQSQHGETPHKNTLSPKIQGLKTAKSNILTSLNPKSPQLAPQNLAPLEKAIKNQSQKSFWEMLEKNQPQIGTTWKILMNLQEINHMEKLLVWAGNLTKETSSTTVKMSMHPSRTNKILLPNTKVLFDLI